MRRLISDGIKDRYGSKQGLARYFYFQMLYRLGVYNKLKQIDFARVEKLVFVCSGNICRSPFGECVARKSIASESFGLHCDGGSAADPRAVHYASTLKLGLGEHKARNIRDYTPSDRDLLLFMEPSHIDSLPSLAGGEPQVTLIPLWCDPPSPYLHDPFNANNRYFNRCVMRILAATETLVGRIASAKKTAGE